MESSAIFADSFLVPVHQQIGGPLAMTKTRERRPGAVTVKSTRNREARHAGCCRRRNPVYVSSCSNVTDNTSRALDGQAG
jgi:hypothetical protein